MKNRVKLKIKKYKRIISNFSYLSFLHIFDLAIPLFTYPYLIKVLGEEIYGITILSQSIVGYFIILTSFGFNISATKEVSIHRVDKNKLSEITSSIFILKGSFLLISFLILFLLLTYTNISQGYNKLFYLTLWMCVYEWIFPLWYFQGIENMRYLTLLSLSSRLIFLFMVLIFIQDVDDYIFLPIINGIGGLVSGMIALYLIFWKDKIKFKIQKRVVLLKYLKDSFPIFISQSSAKIYVNSNKVVLGYLLGLKEVAYYDLAEKIVSVLKTPQGILTQVLFPKISKDQDINFVKVIFTYSMIASMIILVISYFTIDYFILFLGGNEMMPSVNVFYFLALTIPIIAMSNVFGVQLLIPFGYSKYFSYVIVSSGFIYLFLLIILMYFNIVSLLSVSFITLLTEVSVTLFMYYFIRKFHLWKRNTIT